MTERNDGKQRIMRASNGDLIRFVKDNGPVTAEDVRAHFNYADSRGARQSILTRLNAMSNHGCFNRVKTNRTCYFYDKASLNFEKNEDGTVRFFNI